MIISPIYVLLIIAILIWSLSVVITTKNEVRELRNLLNVHMAELKKSVRDR